MWGNGREANTGIILMQLAMVAKTLTIVEPMFCVSCAVALGVISIPAMCGPLLAAGSSHPSRTIPSVFVALAIYSGNFPIALIYSAARHGRPTPPIFAAFCPLL